MVRFCMINPDAVLNWRGNRVNPSDTSNTQIVSSVSHQSNSDQSATVPVPSAPTFTRSKSTFTHSNLHVLYVSSRDTHSFSEFMLTALLKAYKSSWKFNHVRLTNLCSPPVLPRKKPPMETPTSTLLIINNLDDLAPRVQAVLRRYCTQTLNSKTAFLVLINVPRRYRCTPGVLRAGQVKTLERIHTEFLLGFLPENVKSTVTFRVLASTKIKAKTVVKKAVRWLNKYNKPTGYADKLEHLDTPSSSGLLIPLALQHSSFSSIPKKKRFAEYEDLPNPRLSLQRLLRLTQSLSVTNLRRHEKITPHFRPDEPRYDAEYEDFRSRRETRRFVRRLRETMRDIRRVAAPSRATDTSQSGAFNAGRFGGQSGLTGLTGLTLLDEADEDNYEDDEDASSSSDDDTIVWPDSGESRTDTVRTEISTLNEGISLTSSLAAELEPVFRQLDVRHDPTAGGSSADHVAPRPEFRDESPSSGQPAPMYHRLGGSQFDTRGLRDLHRPDLRPIFRRSFPAQEAASIRRDRAREDELELSHAEQAFLWRSIASDHASRRSSDRSPNSRDGSSSRHQEPFIIA